MTPFEHAGLARKFRTWLSIVQEAPDTRWATVPACLLLIWHHRRETAGSTPFFPSFYDSQGLPVQPVRNFPVLSFWQNRLKLTTVTPSPDFFSPALTAVFETLNSSINCPSWLECTDRQLLLWLKFRTFVVLSEWIRIGSGSYVSPPFT